MIGLKIPNNINEVVEYIYNDLKSNGLYNEKFNETFAFPEMLYRLGFGNTLEIEAEELGEMDYCLLFKSSETILLEKGDERTRVNIRFFWMPYKSLVEQTDHTLLMIAIGLGYKNWEVEIK